MINSLPAPLRGAAVAVLAAAALTACGGSSSPPAGHAASAPATSPRPSAGDVPVLSGDYSGQLPIAAYSLAPDQSELIQSAEQKLEQKCLARYGISYPFTRQPQTRTADRRYGLSSPKEASAYGYHLPPSPAVSAPPIPPGMLTVLMGERGKNTGSEVTYHGKAVPRGGCRAEAVERVEGEYARPNISAAAGAIANGSYAQSMRQPAVLAVFRRWSSCMAASGLRYASPMDPLDVPEFTKGHPGAREVPTAVADVECKRKTRLLPVWFGAESRIQTAMIGKQAAALSELQRIHRAQVTEAKAVLGGGASR
ncbi:MULTISPECIES: hypothetical protein [unclassified Streptomyces]|uniref:hypothetical protein n=1 Tax=unclassified Streptomyces TaxID=2593676 RepID=UPI002259DA1D|nr:MULTISPECIES: hypothetical protein [unclassified Streptomyces]MCX5048631.1 hypothetical protein [Streptomyces sp. NBC_00474]MCX5056627.1 hypothetical protein [Streptomyces sp. NBC_00452]